MRKASKTDYGYDSTFPKKLRDIMDSTKTTQAALAAVCGVERQSVAQWRDGNTRPDILSLEKIARYFNVSTDYLLGIKDGTTHDITELMDSLGLSERVISFLQTNKNPIYNECIDALVKDHQKSKDEDSILPTSLLDLLSAFFREASKEEDITISCRNGNITLVAWGNETKKVLANQSVPFLSQNFTTRDMSFVYQELSSYLNLINLHLTQCIHETQLKCIQKYANILDEEITERRKKEDSNDATSET